MTIDTSLVFGLLGFIFFQYSNLTSQEIKAIYNKGPNWVPDWIFGPIWSILYLGVFFSGYYAFDTTQENDKYVPMLVLFIVNVFLNKMWTVLFFDNESIGGALLTLVLIVGTALGVLILMALSGFWLSFGLYAPYVAWLCVALILNIQWWFRMNPKTESIDHGILPTQMKRFPSQAPRLPRRGLLKKV